MKLVLLLSALFVMFSLVLLPVGYADDLPITTNGVNKTITITDKISVSDSATVSINGAIAANNTSLQTPITYHALFLLDIWESELIDDNTFFTSIIYLIDNYTFTTNYLINQ